jgi:hypothetical protein
MGHCRFPSPHFPGEEDKALSLSHSVSQERQGFFVRFPQEKGNGRKDSG